MFFCFGAMAWLIRALLLALVKSLTWMYPPASTQGGQGVNQNSHGAVQGVSAAAAVGRSSYSLFGSSSSNGGGAGGTSPLQQQQLPGCARAVPPSPPKQPGNVPSADAVMLVYGTPLSYAAAVTHGVSSSNGIGNGASVEEGSAGRALGLKSPGKGRQGQPQGGGGTPGRVRFADDI